MRRRSAARTRSVTSLSTPMYCTSRPRASRTGGDVSSLRNGAVRRAAGWPARTVQGWPRGSAPRSVARPGWSRSVALQEAAVAAEHLVARVAGQALEGRVDVDERHVGPRRVAHDDRHRGVGLDGALHAGACRARAAAARSGRASGRAPGRRASARRAPRSVRSRPSAVVQLVLEALQLAAARGPARSARARCARRAAAARRRRAGHAAASKGSTSQGCSLVAAHAGSGRPRRPRTTGPARRAAPPRAAPRWRAGIAPLGAALLGDVDRQVDHAAVGQLLVADEHVLVVEAQFVRRRRRARPATAASAMNSSSRPMASG